MRPTVPPVGVEYGCQGSRPCAKSLVVGGGQVLKTLPLLPWVIGRQSEAGTPLEPAPLAATFFTRRSVWQ
jgi:hypothetical protein